MTRHSERPCACAVVPVKNLAAAKRRLAGVLSVHERRELSLQMLSDVVATLKRADALDAVAILSNDPDVIDLARALNVRVLEDTETCVNAAVAEAARVLVTEGIETMLVVPSDVPLATPAEIDQILEAQATGTSVTIVPDRWGTGTNALACSPPTAIAPCFGPESFIRHQEVAQSAGLTATILELRDLGLDIDIPEDVAALTARKRHTRTHQFLVGVLGKAHSVARNHLDATTPDAPISNQKKGA